MKDVFWDDISKTEGYVEIVKEGMMNLLSFGYLNLNEKSVVNLEFKNREACFVLIEGSCIFKDKSGKEWSASRKNVFDDSPTSFYLPQGVKVGISSKKSAKIAVAMAPGGNKADKRSPIFIPSEQVSTVERGNEGFKRLVRNIILDDFPSEYLLVGETVNREGQWSSYPPHKHDELIEEGGEVKERILEEIYFYQVRPVELKAVQVNYTRKEDGDFNKFNLYPLQNNSLFLIEEGYHPVGTQMGGQVYYLWIMAGPTGKVYGWRDDPFFQSAFPSLKKWKEFISKKWLEKFKSQAEFRKK